MEEGTPYALAGLADQLDGTAALLLRAVYV